MTWVVAIEPHEENPSTNPDHEGKNMSGLIVRLTDGTAKYEVSRIAYNRSNGTAPKKKGRVQPFQNVLRAEIEKAQVAADELNASARRAVDAERAAEIEERRASEEHRRNIDKVVAEVKAEATL